MRFVIALSCVLVLAPPAHSRTTEVVTEEWTDETPQSRGDALLQSALLGDHNRVRRTLGLAPLTWDSELADAATQYARQLSATNRFEHAPRLPGRPVTGENLWMGTVSAYSYHDMSEAWIDEGTDFRDGKFPDVSRTQSWQDVGHFTQMIWRGTRAVGCGIAANRDYEYLVCRYFPAGNVMGERVF